MFWNTSVASNRFAKRQSRKESGDKDSAIEHLETAMEQLYNAIDTLSDIARDPSDRGLIAVLNAYAYRPLVLEYEAMLSEE